MWVSLVEKAQESLTKRKLLASIKSFAKTNLISMIFSPSWSR
jgi:hypothetical protein